MKKILYIVFLFFCSEFLFAQQYDSVKIVLEQMRKDDQAIRNQVSVAEYRFGMHSLQMDSLRIQMSLVDSLNTFKLKNILDNYGWLGISKVGEDAVIGEFIVLHHSEDSTLQEKYLPILWLESEKDEIDKSFVALLEDRVRLRRGDKQSYGTQRIWNDETKRFELAPTENIEGLNERRKSVGLPYDKK